ncbi:hypothetical protein Acr_00g0069890 [Actinidia rufa]|uniref:Uncharacterized protein n=1 Tax=Actinidia rufa TaxID=165716 RepID=A0A7J0DR19_9ERIC|nr:hypothetical protein Acr_00g0069890 [Actinidia rufa]
MSQRIRYSSNCATYSVTGYASGPVNSPLSSHNETGYIAIADAIPNIITLLCDELCQADSGKHGDSDCSSILRAREEELDADECLGQVPDASWMVPQVPSPPTASGLYWPKNCRSLSDAAVFVPDICYSPVQTPSRYHASGTSSKRQRQF